MAVTINFYNRFMEFALEGGMDLDSDTWKIILMNTSHVFTATHENKSQVNANQIASGNGYDQDTKTLASVTSDSTGSTYKFDAADVSWTANPGSIVASDAVIYSDTSTVPAADLLMCSIDFDGEQTAGPGTPFNINWDAGGIFTNAPA